MIVREHLEHNLKMTLDEIERLTRSYYKDILPFLNYSVVEFFNYVSKEIEYKKDPAGIELVMRPRYTIKRKCGDCDDKAVMVLSYFVLKNIPGGYSIVSQTKDKPFHHIFNFIIINNTRIDYDATYNFNKIGQTQDWAKRLNFNFKL